MKTEDIAGKTPDELKKMLLDLKREQLNLRFQKSGGQLTNMSQVRKLRRQVARVKTYLTASDMSLPTKVKTETKKVASKKAAPKKTAGKAA